MASLALFVVVAYLMRRGRARRGGQLAPLMLPAAAAAAVAVAILATGCERFHTGGGRFVYCADDVDPVGLPAYRTAGWLAIFAVVAAVTAVWASVCRSRREAPLPPRLSPSSPSSASDGDDKVARCLAAALKHVSQLEGVSSAGWDHARSVMVAFSQSTISAGGADWLLRNANYSELDPSHLSEHQRRLILRSVVEVAAADNKVTNDEHGALNQITQLMWGCTPNDAQTILAPLLDVIYSRTDPDKADALTVLGLVSDADAAQIRTAHRQLIQRHHPDLAEPDARTSANRRSAEINAAYDYLLGIAV